MARANPAPAAVQAAAAAAAAPTAVAAAQPPPTAVAAEPEPVGEELTAELAASFDTSGEAAEPEPVSEELAAELAAFAASFDTSGEAGAAAARVRADSLGRIDEYVGSSEWIEEEFGKPGAEGMRVWRRPAAAAIEGAVAPFKPSGIVRGITPLAFALSITEKLSEVKRKEECRVLQQTDPNTAVFEKDKYPWPLADREHLFVLAWESRDQGLRAHHPALIGARGSTRCEGPRPRGHLGCSRAAGAAAAG